MKKALIIAASLAALAVASTPASALINAPVPSTQYITYGGIQWAWASPCAAFGPSCSGISLTYQATQGWRIPTLTEFMNRPEVADFGGKCASAYFDVTYSHCDFGDPDYPFGAVAGVKPHGYLFDYGYNITAYGTSSVADSWVVRGTVPEPAAWLMMIAGFGLVGLTLRRTRGAVAA